MTDLRQAATAGMNGALSTAVDVGTLLVAVRCGAPVAVATFVAAAAGALVNFTLNKHLAFRDRSRVTGAQLARFAAVALVTAALLAALMQIVAVGLHVPVIVAKLVCSALVFAAWTYPLQRRVVFKPAAA